MSTTSKNPKTISPYNVSFLAPYASQTNQKKRQVLVGILVKVFPSLIKFLTKILSDKTVTSKDYKQYFLLQYIFINSTFNWSQI